MKHFVLFLFFFAIAFSACKKKNINFVLKGNVSALAIGGNLENVEVKIFTSSLGNAFESLNSQTVTDASGNYSIEIERDKYEKITVQLSKSNFFTLRKTYSFDDFSTAQANELNYKMSPQSWTNFALQNTSPSQGDELKIHKIGGKTDCEDCCNNGFYFFYDVDTIFTCPNDGGTYTKFHYWINEDNHVFDSVYNTPFETATYVISY